MTIQATFTTMGQATNAHLTLARPYRWRGIPGWTPGDVRFRESEPGAASAEAKAARFARFTAARDRGAGVAAAGRVAGVAPKTARAYEAKRTAALQEQQEPTP